MANPRRELGTADQKDIAQLLIEWLPSQRWFAGKGHVLTEVRLSQVSTLPGADAVAHLVVGVQLDGDHWQAYQVPVSLRADATPGASLIGRLPSGGWVHDALADPDAMTAMLGNGAAAPSVDPARTHGVDPAHGEHPVPQLQAVVDPASYRTAAARPMSVEQSNTSILLGDVALLKVFRQLTPGINPDVEVHAALGSVGCRHVGRCLGWVNGGWREPASGHWVAGHLAMVQQLLSPPVDGWGLALERVAAGASFADDAHALGVATGEVHIDLRRALPTRTLGATELGELVDRLHWRLDRAAAAVPELAPMSKRLHERFRALGHLGRPITVQRVHGDFHLGQVLRAADGWKLLDFEGEPGAPMADRVVPDHPLRDVAGMLRSFAYAAAHGRAGLDPAVVATWRADCERAFLAGYAGSGAADPTADADILAAYLVDKAAYEAAYEKRNRPDWLAIPMEALAELAR
ncbi:MAG: aminoglycoside phosphotransferase [Candidatus Nanopelagicales bacterium]